MEDSQAWYLFEVVFLVEGQDFSDAVIFHYDAVDDIPDSRVVI